MPGYNSQRQGTAHTLLKLLCCSMYCLFCVILCIVCVKMCTVLLPPGDNPIAVNKYIISYNTRKTKYIFMSREWHVGQNQNVKMAKCGKFIYLERTLTNQNCIS